MGVQVISAEPEFVCLRAPLEPNLNHRATAFGGSLSALAILCCWVSVRLQVEGIEPIPQIVIQKNSIRYLRSVDDAFEASCRAPQSDEWRRLLDAYRRHRMGRIRLEAELKVNNLLAGRFRGDYVIQESSRKIDPSA